MMRRSVVVGVLCLWILVACGVSEQPLEPSSVPAEAASGAGPYPTPVVATAAVPEPSSVPLEELPVFSDPIMSEPMMPVTNTAPVSPFVVLNVERYPLAPAGDSVIGWTAGITAVLYQSNGQQADLLSLFDLNTYTSTIIVTDMINIAENQHLQPIWNADANTITYARQNPEGAIDIVTADIDGNVKDVLAPNIDVGTSRIDANGQAIFLEAGEFTSTDVAKNKSTLAISAEAKDLLSGGHETYPAAYPAIWFAPDEQHYAVASQSDLYIFEQGQEDPLQHYEFPKGIIHQVLWSPDSSATYFRRREANSPPDYYGSYAQKITESDPQPLGRGDNGVGGLTHGVAWSPDSQWLIVGYAAPRQCGNQCEDRQIIVNPFGSGATVVLTAQRGTSGDAAWSPAMNMIAKPCFFQVTEEHATPEMCLIEVGQ